MLIKMIENFIKVIGLKKCQLTDANTHSCKNNITSHPPIWFLKIQKVITKHSCLIRLVCQPVGILRRSFQGLSEILGFSCIFR